MSHDEDDRRDRPWETAADPVGQEPPVAGAQRPVGRREPILNLAPVVAGIAGLCIAIHLVRAQFLNADQDIELLLRTAFIPVRYVGVYDIDLWAITSPVTYSLLHGDIIHLAVNLVWLTAFGSPLAGRLGAARFLLFWAVTSVAAAAVFFAFHPYDQAPLVGASGAISGMMGAAARFGFQIDRGRRPACFTGRPLAIGEVLRLRGVLVFLAVWLAVNLVTGLFGAVPGYEGQIAWEAHLGGFFAGFLGLPVLLGRKSREA